MIVFIVITAAFVLPLVLYAPQPESLRAERPRGIRYRIRSCAATLTLGLLLIFVAGMLFSQELEIDPEFLPLFALSRQGIFEQGPVFLILTANLVHIDLLHLVANLTALAMLSAYERRVGWRRFAAVFIAAALISSVVDLLWLQPREVSMGASGGLCGLAAAFFLDYRDLSLFDWGKGLLIVLFIIGLYSFLGPASNAAWGIKVNHVAHFAGACAGAAYVYLVMPRSLPAGNGIILP